MQLDPRGRVFLFGWQLFDFNPFASAASIYVEVRGETENCREQETCSSDPELATANRSVIGNRQRS